MSIKKELEMLKRYRDDLKNPLRYVNENFFQYRKREFANEKRKQLNEEITTLINMLLSKIIEQNKNLADELNNLEDLVYDTIYGGNHHLTKYDMDHYTENKFDKYHFKCLRGEFDREIMKMDIVLDKDDNVVSLNAIYINDLKKCEGRRIPDSTHLKIEGINEEVAKVDSIYYNYDRFRGSFGRPELSQKTVKEVSRDTLSR